MMHGQRNIKLFEASSAVSVKRCEITLLPKNVINDGIRSR